MKLEEQVCTREQGLKLQWLGITSLKSLFQILAWRNKAPSYRLRPDIDHDLGFYNNAVSVFTVAELGMLLPNDYTTGLTWYSHSKQRVFYTMQWSPLLEEPLTNVIKGGKPNYETEAEARAAMLIHLLENKLVTAEDCNKRLSA